MAQKAHLEQQTKTLGRT